MAIVYGDIKNALPFTGSPETGLAAEYQGVLVFLHPKPDGGLPCRLSITVKSVAADLPEPPPELVALVENDTVKVESKTGAVDLVVRNLDDGSWDTDAFVAGLDAYIAALKAADCFAKPRCNECMQTEGLSVVSDGDRAIRVCPDCKDRGSDPTKQSTAFMKPDYVAPRGDAKKDASKKGCMGLLVAAMLPVAGLAGAVAWALS